MLRDYYKRLTESGINVLFTRVRKPILEMFKRSHMHEDVGRENFYRYPAGAFYYAWDLIVADKTLPPKDTPLTRV